MLPHGAFSRKNAKPVTLNFFLQSGAPCLVDAAGAECFRKALLQGEVPCFHISSNGDSCFDIPMANIRPWYH